MNKGKHLLRTLHHSKPLWAVFSLLFSLLLIVGSTYSWITYSDERINKTATSNKQLSAVIDEVFEANFTFAPGTSTEKKLTVRNNGQVPAIVRVSLFEFFLSFEVDLTDGEGKGNGNLKTVTSSVAPDVNFDDTSTWLSGKTYKIKSGNYFVAADTYVSNLTNISTAYDYQGTASHAALEYVNINFNTSKVETAAPAAGTTDYWYYDSGYFYYSEVLQSGESTEPLIQSVSLDSSYPNTYKGALYKLVPVMDAHDISNSLLTDWGLSGHAYDMYQDKVAQ